MQVTEINSQGLKREYKVVIPAKDIEAKIDREVEKLQGQIKMPGFRPGKAPLSLLKKLHGKNLIGQVLEETINSSSQAALEENNIRPALQPKIEVISFEDGADLEYSIDVEITPEFDIPDLAAIELERLVVETSEEQVMAAVATIAGGQKNFKKAAKTFKARAGDAVMIDFVGKVGGEEFDGGAADGHVLELGSDSFIPGFEAQLEGVRAGDQKQVKVTFPENYHAENLAGKEAIFEVTVHEVQKPAEMEINDDMAKKFGLENLDALKDVVKKQVEQENHGLSRTKLKRALLDILAEKVSFEIPQTMVEMEFNQIWHQLKKDLHQDELDQNPDMKLDDIADPDDDVRQEYHSIAERRVRLGLLLAEIGQKNEVTVSQEEVTRQISAETRRYPGQEKQVFEFYQKNPEAMAQIRAPLFEEKVVDFILELADVKDRKVSHDELMAAIEAEEMEDSAQKDSKSRKKTDKKSITGKVPAKKAPAKKAPAKKAPAKKTPAKKTSPKKTAVKKTKAEK